MTTAGRVPLFENVRAVLVVLVVMGHSLEPLLAREPLARALYTALYLFHIPAFAFLSGHLSRAELSRKALANIAWSLLAPLTGMATRLALFCCALALTWGVFVLCPRNDGALTRLGGSSLAPFLLHGFVVRGLEKVGGFSLIHGATGVLLVLLGGAILAVLLGQPLIVRGTRPLWGPRRLFQRSRGPGGTQEPAPQASIEKNGPSLSGPRLTPQ